MKPELILPDDFDDYAWEVESKGVFWDLRIRHNDQEYTATFYTPERLAQDASERLSEGKPFFEQNMIVVKDITRDAMAMALSELARDGRIAQLQAPSDSSVEHVEHLESLRTGAHNPTVDLGWMWTDNLRPLAVELARIADYPFSDSDWIAIEHGIRKTDAEDGRWLEYPLGRLAIRAALEPRADETVTVSVDGATAGNEHQQIGLLGDIMRNWHLTGPAPT